MIDDDYYYELASIIKDNEVKLMRRLTAPFGVTKVRKQIAYCNVNIIPRLKALRIKWDEYDTMKIRFCGRTFPMKYIDDGKAEEFIDSLVVDGQATLTMWEK